MGRKKYAGRNLRAANLIKEGDYNKMDAKRRCHQGERGVERTVESSRL